MAEEVMRSPRSVWLCLFVCWHPPALLPRLSALLGGRDTIQTGNSSVCVCAVNRQRTTTVGRKIERTDPGWRDLYPIGRANIASIDGKSKQSEQEKRKRMNL
eukprot:scaffold1389_cov251-Ochromonas_danica.AAC.39